MKDFAIISAPINALLKGRQKTQKITWTKEAEHAFMQLKQALISPPALAAPDFTKSFSIQCDASNVGSSGILTQQQDE